MTTKSQDTDTITYTLTIGGEQVAFLTIWTATRGVANAETVQGHEGNGYARRLWDHANAEAECFHALEHHRTDEGHAWAEAVGGETLDPEDDYQPECITCTDSDH